MIRPMFSAASIALVGLVGCGDGEADRLADLASQVTHEQAQQNQRLADASKAIAQGSQQLVDADADARRDVIKLQQDLRHDQAEIGHYRDALEAERKAIAWERKTESAIGSGLVVLGLLLACLAPLVLAGIALIGLFKEPTTEEEGHILVEELAHSFLVEQVPDSPAFPHAAADPPSLPPLQDEDADQH
jgi:hypothetical protein